MSENRSRGKCLLKRVESIMIREVEILKKFLPGETYKWNNNV